MCVCGFACLCNYSLLVVWWINHCILCFYVIHVAICHDFEVKMEKKIKANTVLLLLQCDKTVEKQFEISNERWSSCSCGKLRRLFQKPCRLCTPTFPLSYLLHKHVDVGCEQWASNETYINGKLALYTWHQWYLVPLLASRPAGWLLRHKIIVTGCTAGIWSPMMFSCLYVDANKLNKTNSKQTAHAKDERGV